MSDTVIGDFHLKKNGDEHFENHHTGVFFIRHQILL